MCIYIFSSFIFRFCCPEGSMQCLVYHCAFIKWSKIENLCDRAWVEVKLASWINLVLLNFLRRFNHWKNLFNAQVEILILNGISCLDSRAVLYCKLQISTPLGFIGIPLESVRLLGLHSAARWSTYVQAVGYWITWFISSWEESN